ncbi:MAG: superoxide dismutase [Bacteroidetes bacterium]|nr:MAG: superoxide dismutase [Bacteroidota bacterium]
MERRKFVKSVGLLTAAAYVGPKVLGNNQVPVKSVRTEGVPASEFPPLPFAYNALEPYIDARTMEIHYDKHHRAYYTNFLNAIKGTPLEGMELSTIFASVSKQPDVVRNNSGGYYNHLFFWNNLRAGSAGPSPELSSALTKTFGSFDKFKEALSTSAKTRFGSGWAWLYFNPDKNLAVGSTPNQDNPLMDISQVKGTPLLTIDVWEHAYYLKYQNKRADYVDAFWNVVNWDEVNKRYQLALKA